MTLTIDIDECAVEPCNINANCTTNSLGSYSCACNQGYSGNGTSCLGEGEFMRLKWQDDTFLTDIDECAANPGPCSINATCSNSAGSFTCTCNQGYSGDGVTCESSVTTSEPTLVDTPPVVTLNVSGGAQIAGENYTLTCTVTGGGTMTPTYRWLRNDSPLSGETSATLSFSPLRQSNSPGSYSCEATLSSTAVRSVSMTITVEGIKVVLMAITTQASNLCRPTIVSRYNG